jgi:hypothetical protein
LGFQFGMFNDTKNCCHIAIGEESMFLYSLE